jgi:hypothetical protein
MSNLVRLICASVLLGWLAAALTMLIPLPSSEVILEKNRDTLRVIVAERLRKTGIEPTRDRIEQEASAEIARAKSNEWITWSAVLVVIAIGALSAAGALRRWSTWRWPLAVTCCLYVAWLAVNILAVGLSPSQFYALSFDGAHRSGTTLQSALQLIIVPILMVGGAIAAFSYPGRAKQELKPH